jgi:hypothetical protein
VCIPGSHPKEEFYLPELTKLPPAEVEYTKQLCTHCEIMADTFYRYTGKRLAPEALRGQALAKYLYGAPFVLLSHGTEADPVFNFANEQAQQLWEMDWNEFTKLPSRLSAEPVGQEERNSLLNRARIHGYIDDYSGIRISRTGKRFRIVDTVLWNLYDASGVPVGQAAMFDRWEPL